MRRLALAALLTGSLTSAAVAQEVGPLMVVVGRRDIHPAAYIPVTSPQPRTQPLSLVVEAGSPWEQPGRLEALLGKASDVLSQCGVALGEAKVVSVRWTAEGLRRLNDQNPYNGPAQMAVMSAPEIPSLRPVGFLFAENSIPSTASAYNGRSVRYFSTQFPAAIQLLNTFWMTGDQETRGRRRDELPSYSVTAHELVHLFGDLGHIMVRPNLMSDYDTPGSKSRDLVPAQCVEIAKLHGLPGVPTNILLSPDLSLPYPVNEAR